MVYISGGQERTAVDITVDTCEAIQALPSTQDESDNRIELHAACAANKGADCRAIRNHDTDVLEQLIYHSHKIGTMGFLPVLRFPLTRRMTYRRASEPTIAH